MVTRKLEKKKVGRPRVGSVVVVLKIPPSQLMSLDEWMKLQRRFRWRRHFGSRQEAILWFMRMGIKFGLCAVRSDADVDDALAIGRSGPDMGDEDVEA